MSSIPGYLLEDYIAWKHNFVVNELGENNPSVGIGETMRVIPKRPRFDIEEIQDIIELYEPFRDKIEFHLSDFNEDLTTWYEYSQRVFSYIPEEIDRCVNDILKRKLGNE